MKILFDHCFPKAFGKLLEGHTIHTTWNMRWDRLSNGKLPAAAAAANFDAMITVDKNLQHQQNLPALPIRVLVLNVTQSKLTHLVPLAPHVLSLLKVMPPGQLAVLHPDGTSTVLTAETPK